MFVQLVELRIRRMKRIMRATSQHPTRILAEASKYYKTTIRISEEP